MRFRMDGRTLLLTRRVSGKSFFHLESFSATVEIHHAFFFLELILDLAHLFLDVTVTRWDGETFLYHTDTEG
jgi:hypothetical protein